MPAAKTRRVPVVDDQESIRGMVRAYVRCLGIEKVDMAESGSEAPRQRVEKILGELS